MTDPIHYFIEYSRIHPLRFMLISFLLFLIVALAMTGVVRIINANRSKVKTRNMLFGDNDNSVKGQNKPKRSSLLVAVIVFQVFIIAFLVFMVRSSRNEIVYHENPSVSSSEYLFGIDISHYQGTIDWDELRTSHHQIEYIFIRATMGKDGVDSQYKRNWDNAKKKAYLRGAYHYYRPNENSTEQFEHFKSVVKLENGDLYPVLDIEKESTLGREKLRVGVKNWLMLAEEHYGVKPIIYTGLNFYENVLKGHVDGYPLWIAAYSGKDRLKNVDWTFHQFTEKVRVKGVKTTVDGNDFWGGRSQIDKLIIAEN